MENLLYIVASDRPRLELYSNSPTRRERYVDQDGGMVQHADRRVERVRVCECVVLSQVGVSWFFHSVGSGVWLDCRELPVRGRIAAYRSRLPPIRSSCRSLLSVYVLCRSAGAAVDC